MTTRKFSFSEGEYYHIYNRGVDKRIIFDDYKDYERFMKLLYLCNSEDSVDIARHFREGKTFKELLDIKRKKTLVDIGAYCLMPNHFHILIREKKEGNTSIFMLKLATAYATYYNSKNTRTGSLFEGCFKAKHIDSDNYLKYVFAYIHLNPVKIIDKNWKENGIKNKLETEKFLNKYRHSSYLDLVGADRLEKKILATNIFPKYFFNFKEFSEFIKDWLYFENY